MRKSIAAHRHIHIHIHKTEGCENVSDIKTINHQINENEKKKKSQNKTNSF